MGAGGADHPGHVWSADRRGPGVEVEDLKLDAGTITVAGTVAKVGESGQRSLVVQTPKTRASLRTISLLPDTIPELRRWRRTLGELKPTALLFADPAGRPLNDDVLRRVQKKAATSIGRADLKDHDLRATAATLAAAAGASVREIQSMLGHTTPAMALKYQTATRERDAERARNMSLRWQCKTHERPHPHQRSRHASPPVHSPDPRRAWRRRRAGRARGRHDSAAWRVGSYLVRRGRSPRSRASISFRSTSTR